MRYLTVTVEYDQLQDVLNSFAEEGWRVVTVFARHPTTAGSVSIDSGLYVAVLERSDGQ